MNVCDYCQHVEMCGWRKDVEEQGCEFFDDGNKWISVSERLPDGHDWYLIVVKEKSSGYQYIPRVATHMGDNQWLIIDTEDADEEWLDDLECVAWQPLPEAYKEGMIADETDN